MDLQYIVFFLYLTECPMEDKYLQGGDQLIAYENIENWEDCGNSKIALFLF